MAEQHTPVLDDEDEESPTPEPDESLEVDPADRAEQEQVVMTEDDEYR
jgi:hypothetical protein